MLDMQIKREQNAMKKQELVQQRIALNHTITMDERQFEITRQQAEWQMGEELEDARNEAPPTEKVPEVADTTSKKAGEAKPDKNPRPRNDAGIKTKRSASTPKLAGDDKAGVIARGQYDNIPFQEG